MQHDWYTRENIFNLPQEDFSRVAYVLNKDLKKGTMFWIYLVYNRNNLFYILCVWTHAEISGNRSPPSYYDSLPWQRLTSDLILPKQVILSIFFSLAVIPTWELDRGQQSRQYPINSITKIRRKKGTLTSSMTLNSVHLYIQSKLPS